MLRDKLRNFKLILASNSPRRQYLMKEAGFEFELRIGSDIHEQYPVDIAVAEIPGYLAALKAETFDGRLKKNEIVITADTVVVINGRILGKPKDYYEAFDMLSTLSGRKHEVITAVCLKTADKQTVFSAHSDVYFRHLTEQEIHHYISEYEPFDKAGAYGAQEWIGYIGMERIEGSFFNVMGLPIQKVYTELEHFIDGLVNQGAANEKDTS